MNGFGLGHPPLAPAILLFSCFRIWMVNSFNGIWWLNKEMLHRLSAWFWDAVDISNSRCHCKDIPCHVFLLCLESKCQSSLFPNLRGSDLLHLVTRDEVWQSGSHVAWGPCCPYEVLIPTVKQICCLERSHDYFKLQVGWLVFHLNSCKLRLSGPFDWDRLRIQPRI